MKTITLEEHFTPPAYVEATSKVNGGPSNASMQAIQGKQLDLGEERLAEMDAAGIDIQVLSLSGILLDGLDSATVGAVVRDANDIAAQAVRAHPDRFAAFAALNMKEPASAAAEFKRCVDH